MGGGKASRLDPRLATEEELQHFIEEMRPEDLDFDSAEFHSLPTEAQYEIIGDLRLRSRQQSHKRLASMLSKAPTPLDFSKAQIANLSQRNVLTQRLLTVTDTIGNSNLQIPIRVASERSREYVLVRNSEADGGGWVLGVRDQGTSNAPIVVEESPQKKKKRTTARIVDGVLRPERQSDEEDDDEVEVVQRPPMVALDPDLRAERQKDFLQAIAQRHTPKRVKQTYEQIIQAEPRPSSSNHIVTPKASSTKQPVPLFADGDLDERPDAAEAESQPDNVSSEEDFEEVEAVGATPKRDRSTRQAPRRASSGSSIVALDNTDIIDQEYQAVLDRSALEALKRREEEDKALLVALRASKSDARLHFDAAQRDQLSDMADTRSSINPSVATESIKSLNSDDESMDEVVLESEKGAEHLDGKPEKEDIAGSSTPFVTLTSDQRRSTPARRSPLLPIPDVPTSTTEVTPKAASLKPQVSPMSPRNTGEEKPQTGISHSTPPSVIVKDFEAYPPKPQVNTSSPFTEATVPPNYPHRPREEQEATNRLSPVLETPLQNVLLETSTLAPQNRAGDEPSVADKNLMRDVQRADKPNAVEELETQVGAPPRPAPVSPVPAADEMSTQDELLHLPSERKEENTQPLLENPSLPPSPVDEMEWEPSPSPPPRIREKLVRSDSPAGLDPDDMDNFDRSMLRASKTPAEEELLDQSFSTVDYDDGSDDGLSDHERAEHRKGIFPAPPQGLAEDEGGVDMNAEGDDYARFLAQIKGRNLDTVRQEIDNEIRTLNQQNKVSMRDSEDITQQMIAQIQLLLRLFGIPYITAPMEAEAQCAELARLELVDGVITDDNDVFLFGVNRCYKNLFNDAKYVECFISDDLERELSLSRERLITLAYLLGSDYTMGLPGIGPVAAMELMGHFPGPRGLEDFKRWWLDVQVGKDDVSVETKYQRSFVSAICDARQTASMLFSY